MSFWVCSPRAGPADVATSCEPGPVEAVSEAVRNGTTRAIDVVSEALSRVERIDAALGAIVALRADEALREAAEMDRKLAVGDMVPGPLCGVPTLVKDLQDVEGMPTRKGSLLLAEAPPAISDDLTPSRLRRAGALIIGKTALSEFATEGYTANLLTGITRNPWNRAYSPGGSSGGSAAAISAGMAPIATATDGGGSIRIPAAFCGLVGIKPTRGVVARRPIPDWIDLSTDGPLATTLADLRLLLAVQSGEEPGDPEAVPGVGLPAGPEHPKLPRHVLASHRTSDLGPLPKEVSASFEAAASAFGDMVGVPLQRLEPGGFFADGDPDQDWFVLATAEHIGALGRDNVIAGLAQMHPGAREFMRYGLGVGIDEYIAARRRRFGYVRVLDELLGADTVLLTPTVAVSAILAEGRLSPQQDIGALPDETYSTALQNITGHPAITVPAGQCGPLPFGLQITGPRYADRWLLDLAAAWEASYPWPRHPPGYAPFPSTP
jgi:Asp-tRNA(Asn)/Glu-tRNA(Gln) amidotransferase A subunit family amidase